MDKDRLINFISRLSKLPRIILQAHDFPDHDAISSSYAMSVLLETQGIKSLIIYNGEIG